MDTAWIRDHIAACLYGGALGDALGYTVEFQSWSSIRAEYGENGIDRLVPQNGKARISDDTQMTLFTAEGLVFGWRRARETGRAESVERCIYEAYLCWLQTQGYPAASLWDPVSRLKQYPEMNRRRAPGNTCLSALASGRMGTIQKPLNHSRGCGGVMRTAPLGFLPGGTGYFGSPLLNGAKAAAITHGDPLGWLPAAMLSDLVGRCLYKRQGTLKELTETSLAATAARFAKVPKIREFEALMKRAISLAETPAGPDCEVAAVDEPAIRSLGEGWVGDEALAIAVYAALRYPADLRRGLIAAVNHNGDSDSTGAIAGNILGAWLGMEAVPRDWAAQLELTDAIEELADDLKQILEQGAASS